MNQTWENNKKSNFGPNFGQNVVPDFFSRVLYLADVASYHCIQFQGNLLNQTWKIGKKPSFGHDLGRFGPNLVVPPILFFMNFTSTRCQTLI